jgi:hypothetical protein
MPPEDIFLKLSDVFCKSKKITNCSEWEMYDSFGDRYREFSRNLRHTYIGLNMKLPIKKESLDKLNKQFDDNFVQISNSMLSSYRDNLPYSVRILILKKDNFGCIVRGECIPAIYVKISKSIIKDDQLKENILQDAYLESLNYLDKLFIGVLEAEFINENKISDPLINLLINDSNSREITCKIDDLLDVVTTELLVIGWIGTQYIPQLIKLHKEKVNIYFITHKPQEAKNEPWRSEIEEAFEHITKEIGLNNICIDPNIHGRILIADNKALIGSMDLNSSSLSGTHTEFATYTEDPEIVRKLRIYFFSKFTPLKNFESKQN